MPPSSLSNKKVEQSFHENDMRLFKRAGILKDFFLGELYTEISQQFRVCVDTIRVYKNDFLIKQFDSFTREKPTGRKPRLNSEQLKSLRSIIIDGPEKYGFTSGIWSCVLIKEVILNEFGALYSVCYISSLVKNLGFSLSLATYLIFTMPNSLFTFSYL